MCIVETTYSLIILHLFAGSNDESVVTNPDEAASDEEASNQMMKDLKEKINTAIGIVLLPHPRSPSPSLSLSPHLDQNIINYYYQIPNSAEKTKLANKMVLTINEVKQLEVRLSDFGVKVKRFFIKKSHIIDVICRWNWTA